MNHFKFKLGGHENMYLIFKEFTGFFKLFFSCFLRSKVGNYVGVNFAELQHQTTHQFTRAKLVCSTRCHFKLKSPFKFLCKFKFRIHESNYKLVQVNFVKIFQWKFDGLVLNVKDSFLVKFKAFKSIFKAKVLIYNFTT